jgi:hypothetical protein
MVNLTQDLASIGLGPVMIALVLVQSQQNFHPFAEENDYVGETHDVLLLCELYHPSSSSQRIEKQRRRRISNKQ